MRLLSWRRRRLFCSLGEGSDGLLHRVIIQVGIGPFDSHEFALKVVAIISKIVPTVIDRCKGLELIAGQKSAKVVLWFEMRELQSAR